MRKEKTIREMFRIRGSKRHRKNLCRLCNHDLCGYGSCWRKNKKLNDIDAHLDDLEDYYGGCRLIGKSTGCDPVIAGSSPAIHPCFGSLVWSKALGC